MNQEVLETVHESHEAFLTRRGGQMASMIGLLSSRLEMIAMTLGFDMEFDKMTADQWLRSAKQSRMEILETLIVSNKAWAEMQQYEDGDIGKQFSDEKLAKLTTELESLKTLAL